MPIATPQGTLDFKSVDKVTFVGASSNTVIDTTTGSLGVGVGVGGPTSNLHVVGNTRLEGDINMLHTSNTASIKLNSNVVTEFPRSKKLIKYPRVAMTANSSGGYVASANSEYPDGTNYHAFRVFNNRGINVPYVAGVGWEAANTDTFGDNGLWGGSPASGASTSSSANTTMTLEEGNTIYGEWLQIQLPTKIRLEYVNFLILSGSAHAMAHRAPRAGYILGSNNGTNWVTLKFWSGIVYDTWTAYYDKFYKFDIDKEVDNYQYFRFVWTETASGSGNSLSRYASCQELEFWGTPEYDPEAHGTDVTVKSYPNVPNTDWLEVYYDGQDYTQTSDFAGTGGVVDKVGGDQDGTAGTGVTFDSTYKAFVFDGSADGKITGTHGLGTGTGITPTISLWFRMNDTSTSRFFVIGDQGPTNTSRQSMSVGHHQGFVYLDYWYSEVQTPSTAVIPGVWYHLAIVHKGPGTTATGSQDIYLNNVKQTLNLHATNNSNDTFDLQGTGLTIGADPSGTNPLTGSIANFRLFNRALTSDEIYQLYAYQKEYFGHGDLSMTLKAGRLGIGTSDPRAALDVRGKLLIDGRLSIPGRVAFAGKKTNGTTNDTTTPVVFNSMSINVGGCYDTSTGRFTAPVDGLYVYCVQFVTGSGTNVPSSYQISKVSNGTTTIITHSYTDANGAGNAPAGVNSVIVILKAGDYITINLVSGYGIRGDNHNFIYGYLLE